MWASLRGSWRASIGTTRPAPWEVNVCKPVVVRAAKVAVQGRDRAFPFRQKTRSPRHVCTSRRASRRPELHQKCTQFFSTFRHWHLVHIQASRFPNEPLTNYCAFFFNSAETGKNSSQGRLSRGLQIVWICASASFASGTLSQSSIMSRRGRPAAHLDIES